MPAFHSICACNSAAFIYLLLFDFSANDVWFGHTPVHKIVDFIDNIDTGMVYLDSVFISSATIRLDKSARRFILPRAVPMEPQGSKPSKHLVQVTAFFTCASPGNLASVIKSRAPASACCDLIGRCLIDTSLTPH